MRLSWSLLWFMLASKPLSFSSSEFLGTILGSTTDLPSLKNKVFSKRAAEQESKIAGEQERKRAREQESTRAWDHTSHIFFAEIRSGGMRGAVKSGHRALGATVGAVFGGAIHLAKPYLLSTKLISPSPLAPRAFRRTRVYDVFLLWCSLLTSVPTELSWATFCCSGDLLEVLFGALAGFSSFVCGSTGLRNRVRWPVRGRSPCQIIDSSNLSLITK